MKVSRVQYIIYDHNFVHNVSFQNFKKRVWWLSICQNAILLLGRTKYECFLFIFSWYCCCYTIWWWVQMWQWTSSSQYHNWTYYLAIDSQSSGEYQDTKRNKKINNPVYHRSPQNNANMSTGIWSYVLHYIQQTAKYSGPEPIGDFTDIFEIFFR